MARYVTQATARPQRMFYGDPAPPLPHPTVYVGEPVDTGLIDPNGNKIMRVPDQIGFLRGK